MNNFCEKCGSPLNEQGVCPVCTANENAQPPVEQTVSNNTVDDGYAEVVYEPKKEPVYNTIDVDQPNTGEYSQSYTAQQDAQPPVQAPSKFVETVKQTLNIIKCFFSKNTADALSDQYMENLPVWTFLLGLPAIFTAISTTVLYDSIVNSVYQLIGIDITNFFSGVGVFFLALVFVAVMEASYVFAVYFYLKIMKKKLSLNRTANFVASAYLPVAVTALISLLFCAWMPAITTVIDSIATVGFVIILSEGIRKILGRDKPVFWGVLALFAAAIIAAAVVIAVIMIPVIVVKVVSFVSSQTYSNSLFSNYYY